MGDWIVFIRFLALVGFLLWGAALGKSIPTLNNDDSCFSTRNQIESGKNSLNSESNL